MPRKAVGNLNTYTGNNLQQGEGLAVGIRHKGDAQYFTRINYMRVIIKGKIFS